MLKKEACEKNHNTYEKRTAANTRKRERYAQEHEAPVHPKHTLTCTHIASHPHKKNTAGLGFAASSIISSWAEVVPFPLQPWTLTWELWEFSSLVGVLGVSVSPPLILALSFLDAPISCVFLSSTMRFSIL